MKAVGSGAPLPLWPPRPVDTKVKLQQRSKPSKAGLVKQKSPLSTSQIATKAAEQQRMSFDPKNLKASVEIPPVLRRQPTVEERPKVQSPEAEAGAAKGAVIPHRKSEH